MGSSGWSRRRAAARLLVLAGGVACAVSPLLVWWVGQPSDRPSRGADGLGALVGTLGVIITVIATSRLLGYRELDTRPAGYLAVAAMVLLTFAMARPGQASGVGPGVWVALAGIVGVVFGTLLD